MQLPLLKQNLTMVNILYLHDSFYNHHSYRIMVNLNLTEAVLSYIG